MCGVDRLRRSAPRRSVKSVHAPQACAVRVRWRVALHDRRRGDRDRRAYAEQGGVVRSSVCWFVCLFACWFACLSAFVGVRKITRFCAHCSLITQTFAARMPRRRSSCRHTWRLSGMRSHAHTRVPARSNPAPLTARAHFQRRSSTNPRRATYRVHSPTSLLPCTNACVLDVAPCACVC